MIAIPGGPISSTNDEIGVEREGKTLVNYLPCRLCSRRSAAKSRRCVMMGAHVINHHANLLALLHHPEHFEQGVELASALGNTDVLAVALEEPGLPHWLALLRHTIHHAPRAAATGLGRSRDWQLDPTGDLFQLFTLRPTEEALFELALRMSSGEWGEVEKRLLDNLDPVWLPEKLSDDQRAARINNILHALSRADMHSWVPFYEALHFAGHEDAAMEAMLDSPLIAHPGIRRYIVENYHMAGALRRVLTRLLPGAPMSLWELLAEWPEAGAVLDKPLRIQQLREALKSARPADPALPALLTVVRQWTEPGDGRLVNGPVLRLVEESPIPAIKLAAATAICAPIPVGRCSRILRSTDSNTARAMLRGLGESEDDQAASLLVDYADGPLQDAVTAEAAEALGCLLIALRPQLEWMGKTLTLTGQSTGILLASALSGNPVKLDTLAREGTQRPDAALAVPSSSWPRPPTTPSRRPGCGRAARRWSAVPFGGVPSPRTSRRRSPPSDGTPGGPFIRNFVLDLPTECDGESRWPGPVVGRAGCWIWLVCCWADGARPGTTAHASSCRSSPTGPSPSHSTSTPSASRPPPCCPHSSVRRPQRCCTTCSGIPASALRPGPSSPSATCCGSNGKNWHVDLSQ